MTLDANVAERLTGWLRTQLPDADDVCVEGLDRVNFGHSAEMMVLTIVTRNGSQDVVLRLRPKPPALLEPYDLARQFKILRALQDSAVRVPRALWLEDSGDVLGRPFFVMERVGGDVYEMEAPADAAGETVVRMCQSLAEQLAAIHSVDLRQSGLGALDDGGNHLHRELDHWASRNGSGQAGFAARPGAAPRGATRQHTPALPESRPGARGREAGKLRIQRW